MKKKYLVLTVIALVVSLVLGGCGGGSAPASSAATGSSAAAPAADAPQYEDYTLLIGMSGTEQSTDYFVAQEFKKNVEEKSGGAVKVELYPNNILAGGSFAEAANLLTQGDTYPMGIVASSVMSNLDPTFLVVQLPFIFESYDQMETYYDSTGGEWFEMMLAKYNLKYLKGFHNGLKQWTNNKAEKHTPDDFKNFKIRIPGGEVSQMTWQAIGADPVGISWPETYTALQQGTVDGHENSYPLIYSNNIHEIQKYITEANYQYECFMFVFNQARWDELSPALQELFTAETEAASMWGRQLTRDQEVEVKQEMLDSGNIINVLTPEERQAFIDITRPVIDHFRDIYGQEAYDAWGIK